jgi:hypothetical protein
MNKVTMQWCRNLKINIWCCPKFSFCPTSFIFVVLFFTEQNVSFITTFDAYFNLISSSLTTVNMHGFSDWSFIISDELSSKISLYFCFNYWSPWNDASWIRGFDVDEIACNWIWCDYVFWKETIKTSVKVFLFVQPSNLWIISGSNQEVILWFNLGSCSIRMLVFRFEWRLRNNLRSNASFHFSSKWLKLVPNQCLETSHDIGKAILGSQKHLSLVGRRHLLVFTRNEYHLNVQKCHNLNLRTKCHWRRKR